MDVRRDAVISSCGRYRYLLTRSWYDDSVSPAMAHFQAPRQIFFVMLNPSTADAYQDDPTIRRCVGFGKRDGYNSVHVANLYAGRATKPDALFHMDDPEGPGNRDVWQKMKGCGATIVCGWGADPRARAQAEVFTDFMRDVDLYCLGVTKHGQPKHPLYLRGDTRLELFRGRAA